MTGKAEMKMARKKKMKTGFSTYKDKRGKVRWRVVDPDNYKIIGSSSQGYANKRECMDNARMLGVLDRW